MFAKIAATPPVVIPDEKVPLNQEGVCCKMSGTNSTPNPQAKLTANTSIAFRFIFCDAMIRMPEAATVPNISNVAPPKTGAGMIEKMPPTKGNILSMTRSAAI